MAAENHLTVRDYFDKVLVGRTLHGKAYSQQIESNSGSRQFQRILASERNQQLYPNKVRPTGLTVVDYLKNPVRIKYHDEFRSDSSNSEQHTTTPDKTDSVTAGSNPKDSGFDRKANSQAKERSMGIIAKSDSDSSANPRATNEYLVIEKNIQKAARKYDLSAGLLKGVIRAESNFQINAVSHAGAQGLMQLMPGTARELGVENPFDIEQNIDGGARYLRKMLDSFDGDIKLALAAYNAGPAAVEKYGGQVPPYQETEQYVRRVLRFSRQMA